MIICIEANGTKPVISDTFTLDKLALAFGHQAAQQHFGKFVVTLYVPMIEKLDLVCKWQRVRTARALDTNPNERVADSFS